VRILQSHVCFPDSLVEGEVRGHLRPRSERRAVGATWRMLSSGVAMFFSVKRVSQWHCARSTSNYGSYQHLGLVATVGVRQVACVLKCDLVI
jgi:hypothetical protein